MILTRSLRIGFAIFLIFLCSFSHLYSSSKSDTKFSVRIFQMVRSCIARDPNIPSRKALYPMIDILEKNGKVLETGSDDLRIKYVSLQGCMEHVFACLQTLGEIDTLIGVIHTPTPATPLCVKPEGAVENVLDPSIRQDPAKLFTVCSRAQILREYLMKGGKLYIAYPQGGLQKRSEEQQKIYRDELEHYPGKLIDRVLSTTKIPDDMIGATFLLRHSEKGVFAFSIKAKQANDIQAKSEWGIWFGPVSNQLVSERIEEVLQYLLENGGPNLRLEL